MAVNRMLMVAWVFGGLIDICCAFLGIYSLFVIRECFNQILENLFHCIAIIQKIDYLL